MKYIKDTLSYFKSNILLLPTLIIAMLACAPLLDVDAYNIIAASEDGGFLSVSYYAWFDIFFLFNTSTWVTIVLSIIAYILLIFDIALMHSLTDKHVRFGTKSFNSLVSSITINLAYSFIIVVALVIANMIIAVVLAAIMKTITLIGVRYLYIFGFVLCIAISLVLLYVLCHFILWLPCLEITGYRIFEALSYSYSLAKLHIWKIVIAIGVPFIIIFAIVTTLAFTCPPPVLYIAAPILMGCLFTYAALACYIIFVDAEGIEREDLKKY